MKTSHGVGSGMQIWIDFKPDHDQTNIHLAITLKSTVTYFIKDCTDGYQDFPIQPTDAKENIWRFEKPEETAIRISCNGVRLMELNFNDGHYQTCPTKWGVGWSYSVSFDKEDTATQFFRSAPLTEPVQPGVYGQHQRSTREWCQRAEGG